MNQHTCSKCGRTRPEDEMREVHEEWECREHQSDDTETGELLPV